MIQTTELVGATLMGPAVFFILKMAINQLFTRAAILS